MPAYAVENWDSAYANSPNIPGGDTYPDRWAKEAAHFRDAMAERASIGIRYGSGERQTLDLFLPDSPPTGLVVFVHGGYWMRFSPASFSHLAAGPMAHGWAVAMPSYTLCPSVRIADITAEVASAIEAAAGKIAGPIRLAGHSAGGHLVTRMLCTDSPLAPATVGRIAHTVSISGVHDLRPLLRLAINATLGLDNAQARRESPALCEPIEGARVTCWVGACERSEFVRQNALLANVWRGLGASTLEVLDPDRHHFDVVEALAQPGSRLTRELLR